MREAGVDTTSVVRALMVALLEGTLIYGVFHGDLHPGNLLVLPDGRVGLFDHGITGRLSEAERGLFLKVILSSFAGDHRAVLEGYQGLGALPKDADLDAFLAEIPLAAPNVDPTTAGADELMAEMRRVTKAMVAHGLKIPKEVVLYMKDVLFLDAAIANLAPDLNLLAEFSFISAYFAATYGETIARQLGIDPSAITFDPSALLQAVGMDPSAEALTPRQIRAQREEVAAKLQGLD
jgi:ubiquinone biosynthesis protein